MRHITKILAVVMAIVLLSGQVAYAWDRFSGLRRFDSIMKAGLSRVKDKITTDLSRAKDGIKKIAPYLVPGVGIGVIGARIARDPALRDKIREGARKIAPYLVPGMAGIAVFRKPFGLSVSRIMKPVEDKVAGTTTGKTGMEGFSKLGGNITGLDR